MGKEDIIIAHSAGIEINILSMSQELQHPINTSTVASNGVALMNRSHWGLLQFSDADRLQFLHNQTTNDIKSLQPGQGRDGVFINSTGRTLDLATVYATEDTALVLVSPERRQTLLTWLDRYIFPMDRIELADISGQYAIFTLVGSQSDEVLRNLGLEAIIGHPRGQHQVLQLNQTKVRVAVGSGLGLPGYTFFVPVDQANQVWSSLQEGGVTPIDEEAWEKLRIQQGRPRADHELTEDYNPLEAGLWKAISFNKGCYIGQETIARLNTYKGVKQRLWGVQLEQPVAVNTPVYVEDSKVGTLTSCISTPEGATGLAYIRTKAGGEGLEITVDGVKGKVISVPFLTHEYPD
jgi:folate-binding protein YgfZ